MQKTITTPSGGTVTAQQAAATIEKAEEIKKVAPVTIGFGQIGNPTPRWANWMFRIFFYTAQFTVLVLAMLPAERMSAPVKVEIIFWLAIVTMGVHGFSKLAGIDTRKMQEEARDAFPGSGAD